MPYKEISLGFILLALLACSGDSKTQSRANVNASLPADFDQFYRKFHADSAYQMEHIMFPLAGTATATDSLTDAGDENFKWQRKTWKLHRHIDLKNTSFERDFVVFDEKLITERIYSKAGFGMRRRFAKIDDDWYLIYYEGMKPMK